MPSRTNDLDWEVILRRIKEGKCTPFLGAGVNYGILDLGATLSRKLAEKFHYPFPDAHDLVRVSQYVGVVKNDPIFVKEEVLDLLGAQVDDWQKKVKPPDFFRADTEPLGILASLPFPIYMTTNYDDLLRKALAAHDKNPKRELCRWNKALEDRKSVFTGDFDPSPATPVVFHLHGHDEVIDSLVLTEDDYLNFLVNLSRDASVSRDHALLPPRVQQALTGSSLMFVGYALADWNFRVLFKGLVGSMEDSLRRMSIAVQLPMDMPEQEKYLEEYFRGMKVEVYWGNAQEFAQELKEQWGRYDGKY